jgi:anti-anti-sigma factor
VSLRGELDISSASVLQTYLSDIRWQAPARAVADLTDLAFIDCVCLGVLVRHCIEMRRQNGSFALAGPRPAVRRILALTGLLTWFEVHDTVEEAVGAGPQRSPCLLAAAARSPDHGLVPAPAASASGAHLAALWGLHPVPARGAGVERLSSAFRGLGNRPVPSAAAA